MAVRLLRPLLAILTAVALVGAPAVQAAAAPRCDTTRMADGHRASGGDARTPAPCKATTPACSDVLGCVSAAGLTAPAISAGAAPLAWTPAAYSTGADAREGLSVEPALKPPIPFA